MGKQLARMLKSFLDFLRTLYLRRFLIYQMAKREISMTHAGSKLGFAWSFIHPLVLILVLWVVFAVGFKSAPAKGIPFAVWLTAGMAVWQTSAEVLMGATGAVRNNPHLVKKVVFPLSILPVVRLVASSLTHTVFLIFLILLIVFYRLPFSIYWFQALYYLTAMCVLALGLTWLTSALNVFVPDTGQLVPVFLQIGFWVTPIFWDLEMMPENLQFLFTLNPMFYVVQGYRDSFLFFVPFWDHWNLTLYFWSLTFVIFVAGALGFQRLKPPFAGRV